MELEDAIQCINERVKILTAVKVSIDRLSNETLAEDIYAAADQPPFPRSPLDGYAFRGEDSSGAGKGTPTYLKVIGKLHAGDETQLVVHAGEAVRLMTGARIPEGADAVIRQEDTDCGADRVALYKSVSPYQNYCFQGEDYKKGTRLLRAGTSLDFTAVAVLASNGSKEVLAVSKPEVAVIATGSELIRPGEKLTPGKIYDCNRFMLCARLRELGIKCRGLQIADEPEAVCRAIREQLETADAVITTGGVSVGEKDVMNEVLPLLDGEILFTGLELKPGSPSKFALVNGKPVLALSGNPFAAAAVFELLGRPLLGALQGSAGEVMTRTTAVFENGLSKSSPGRRLLRGRYQDGTVVNPAKNSSGQIGSLQGCNCLIDIPAGSGPVAPGAEVGIWLF